MTENRGKTESKKNMTTTSSYTLRQIALGPAPTNQIE